MGFLFTKILFYSNIIIKKFQIKWSKKNVSYYKYIVRTNKFLMHKTAIFSLSLIVLLLMGTTLNMNMFSTANAQRIGQYDNSYQQSTYGEPYPSTLINMMQFVISYDKFNIKKNILMTNQ